MIKTLNTRVWSSQIRTEKHRIIHHSVLLSNKTFKTTIPQYEEKLQKTITETKKNLMQLQKFGSKLTANHSSKFAFKNSCT